MAKRKSALRTVKHTVVTFDICSSSDILEDLIRTENVGDWRDLLIKVKKFLIRKQSELDFVLYKFTGDGWILLFDYDCSGKELFDFLKVLSGIFERNINRLSKTVLETTHDILGLTFGIDRGTLIRFVMAEKTEYIGRAINVACRLQGAIKDKDKKPQYKVLMTKNVYKQIKGDIENYKQKPVSRKLHNIAGDKTFNCVKITIPV